MVLGDIFLWDTTHAIGHDRRWKYHVYVCGADWREGHTFLFISKADYGGDYKITKADYPFLDLEFSFVSCGNIVCYDDQELGAFPQKPLGRLTRAHLRDLYASIVASDTMVEWEKQRVCNAIPI
jgi:hypothetical protein